MTQFKYTAGTMQQYLAFGHVSSELNRYQDYLSYNEDDTAQWCEVKVTPTLEATSRKTATR